MRSFVDGAINHVIDSGKRNSLTGKLIPQDSHKRPQICLRLDEKLLIRIVALSDLQ